MEKYDRIKTSENSKIHFIVAMGPTVLTMGCGLTIPIYSPYSHPLDPPTCLKCAASNEWKHATPSEIIKRCHKKIEQLRKGLGLADTDCHRRQGIIESLERKIETQSKNLKTRREQIDFLLVNLMNEVDRNKKQAESVNMEHSRNRYEQS